MKRALIAFPMLLIAGAPLAADAKLNEGTGEASAAATSSFWEPDALFALKFMSDTPFRGVSGTDSKPGMSALAEAYTGPFYVGTMWFNIDNGSADPQSAEWDLWVGVRPAFDNLRFDFNANYAIDLPKQNAEYMEYKAGVEADFIEGTTVGLNYFYSPDWRQLDVREDVVEATAKYKIDDSWSVSGALGKSFMSAPVKDWTYWNAGVTYNVTPQVSLDLRYHDTDIRSADCVTRSACHARVVFSVNIAATARQILAAVD
ncbi:TorF family putative porin [Agrobacterium sp. P15N1-A]|uniref:TorF family putative porin n=1 Tax=Agrobacterium sp. P15N1-A TaxID=3342820 RepID=UPI0037D5879D